MRMNHWRKIGGRLLVVGLATLWMQGCSDMARQAFIKDHAKGPYLHDRLASGTSTGSVDGGQFTTGGWSPGSDGMITYNLPGVSQAKVEVKTKGLDRSKSDSVFITLYEPSDSMYADPFIIHNPYLVKVGLKNFSRNPVNPFDFLWTMKTFPAGTSERGRYVEGIPQGGSGYEQLIASSSVEVFPDEFNTVAVEWKYGKAVLSFNGKEIGEHTYRPSVYNPQALKLVIGKSPAGGSFDLDGLVISDVTVSLPGV